MTAPRTEVVQMTYQNPHASMPLIVPVAVVCNTPDEALERNITTNAAMPFEWIAVSPEHSRPAVMVGGGPSAADHIEDIRKLAAEGAAVFGMNAASRWLREREIGVHYQVIADAKPETAQLVDPGAHEHLIASQVDAATIDALPRAPKLWHLEIGHIERLFPQIKVARGGYALIGGGAAVGNSALCLAYAMGYRTFHIFGFDSSHRGGQSHAYDQPMNAFMPCVEVEWAGRTYYASLAMKAQAEKFQITGQALEQAGCKLHVYGDGLLPAMWNTPPQNLTERDKYRTLWQFDGYRVNSPGEQVVDQFLDVVKPEGLIADFGCGTGRASLALADRGYDVILIDFADNCRDDEALGLPFLEWDLARPSPLRAAYGLCTDVMEHIPLEQVAGVISNIMDAGRNVFFQISTVPDGFGAVVHQTLHHTVRPHHWWADRFRSLGYEIAFEHRGDAASQFYVRTLSDRGNH